MGSRLTRGATAVFLIGWIVSCALYGSADEPPTSPPSDAGSDAGSDATADDRGEPRPRCNGTKPFGKPVPFDALNTLELEETPRLSADELTLYFSRQDTDGGDWDIHVAVRTSLHDPFGPPRRLYLDTDATEVSPTMTPNELVMLFSSTRSPSLGGEDIFLASRASTIADFGSASPVTNVSSTDHDYRPFLRGEGELWLASFRPGKGAGDIYRSTSIGGTFTTPVGVDELNTSADENAPTLPPDGLEIFFASDRPGGAGSYDIFSATRSSLDAPFSPPVRVTELSTPFHETPGWLSADHCRLYMSATDPVTGSWDLYVAERPPAD